MCGGWVGASERGVVDEGEELSSLFSAARAPFAAAPPHTFAAAGELDAHALVDKLGQVERRLFFRHRCWCCVGRAGLGGGSRTRVAPLVLLAAAAAARARLVPAPAAAQHSSVCVCVLERGCAGSRLRREARRLSIKQMPSLRVVCVCRIARAVCDGQGRGQSACALSSPRRARPCAPVAPPLQRRARARPSKKNTAPSFKSRRRSAEQAH